MLTDMPSEFIAAVAVSASSTVIPATKRLDKRRPTRERSAIERRVLLSESAMKIVRNITPSPRPRRRRAPLRRR